MGLELSGFLELTGDLEKMAQALEGSVVKNALERGGSPILERAKQNVHRISGDLYNSLTIVIKGKGSRITAHIGTQKGSKGFYATMVEYGHGGDHPAGANPFLKPAYDAEVENAYGIIKQELAAATEKIGE